MNIKKTAAVLLAAAVSTACLASVQVNGLETLSEYENQISSNTSLSVNVNAQKTIVLNSASGSTAEDIQNALLKLKSTGGTVKLVGNFNIDKTVILYSNQTIDATKATITGTADILLNSYKVENVAVKGGTWNLSDSSMLAKISTCNTGNFDSLTVNGGGSFQYGCFFVYRTDNTSIRNCTFNRSTSQAIFVYGSANLLAFNCKVNNADGHGIYVWGSANAALIGNTILGANGDGLKCCKCTNSNVCGNTVKNVTLNTDLDYDALRDEARSGCGIMVMENQSMNVGKAYKYNGKTYVGNTVTNCENYGMVINLCEDTTVYKTNFTDVGTNGIHSTASARSVIQNCSFKNCGQIGIFLTPGPIDSEPEARLNSLNTLIYSNKIENCGTFGIMLSKSKGTKVRQNTIKQCKDYGIFCNSAHDITISGNTISNTKVRDGFGISYTSDSTNIDTDIPIKLSKTAVSLGKGETFTITSSNNSVTWLTSNSSIATVSNGKITARGIGTTKIIAKTPSGRTAACTVTVRNAPSTVTLPKTVLTLGVGESYQFGSVVPSNAAAATRTFRTSNSSIVRMTKTDWEGHFIAVKPGVAWVTVRLYNGKEASCKIIVKDSPKTVSLSKSNLTLKVGQSASLSAIIPANSGAATRTFYSTNSTILKMTKTNWTGEFTALRPGTAQIAVRLYNGKEARCTVKVVN